MKTIFLSLLIILSGILTATVRADTFSAISPNRVTVTKITPNLKVSPPKTGPAKMDKPGPVQSPDPYFTLKIGGSEVYRDAQDRALAYYRPVFHLGKRNGTPLAAGVGELAAVLDGFLFRYYKFESGGNPKWADIQTVIVAEKPADVTLETVRKYWTGITRLIPLPYRLDVTTGVSINLPYPVRKTQFSQQVGKDGTDELMWYQFATNTKPTPPDLLTNKDNNVLNEMKARDYASLIISDLADMPSFQPTLEVRVVYPGWTGASPLSRNLQRAMLVSPLKLNPTTNEPRFNLNIPHLVDTRTVNKNYDVRIPAAKPTITTPAVARPAMMLNQDALKVFGTLKPREDIDYIYSDSQQIQVSLPISYPKEKTPNYDYYFLSDSGRFGGPFFEPSTVPNRPQRAESPEGFTGYWYESHSFGKRLVWAAPREMKLRWQVESGLRPSCRFSLTSDSEGKLMGHIAYDLYPDFSTRALNAAIAELVKLTGEKIDMLPFTDLIDANQIAMQSANPIVSKMIAAKQVTINKLNPKNVDDAWFRVNVDMPVDDWANFTLFMKTGDIGTWDCGIITGASTGVAEKVTFKLNGDLLHTMGGPIVASRKSYDAGTGGYEVTLDNYGMAPLAVKGLRFLLTGAERTIVDSWLDGKEVTLSGVGSASSFDQRDGASGSMTATVNEPSSTELKTLMDSGKYQGMSIQLTTDMIAPSSSADDVGGIDPDIMFSFLRSLCYQYIGSSEIIKLPVAPAEITQWADYNSGSIVIRFQGFVYTQTLDLAGDNKLEMRRIPREGAYAVVGKPGEADLVEYRAIFVKKDGAVINIPAQAPDESRWLTGDITGINLDMTQAIN